MAANRTQFSHLIAPGYRKIVFETYRERPVEGSALINVGSMDKAFIDDANMAGFGVLLTKPEGGRVLYQDPVQGHPKRYTASTYGLGFQITEELYEDELYGIVGNKWSKALGRSVRQNFEVIAASVLNNGFNSAFTGFNPGEPLFYATHANVGNSGTQSNVGTADLALASLQAAVEAFHGWTDERGLQIAAVPRKLVVGVSNMWLAGELLGATLKPGTNYNDPNIVGQMGLSNFISHYLTDADSWFLLGEDHDMNYMDRRLPRFSNTDDFDSGNAKFKVTRRNAAGFGDWRNVYGSAGAG